MWKQLIQPNLNQVDLPGWCLRFVQSAYNVNHEYPYAWEQWINSTQHTDPLPNVIVPVYFSWTGNIDGVTQNWGDVAIYVPNRGILGTPLHGGGDSNRWDTSVEARAAAIGGGAHYVGWSEDLGGQAIIEQVADPTPAPAPSTGQYVRIFGDYRTLYQGPGTNPFQKLAPNMYGGYLDYKVLSRSGNFVEIQTQMFGVGWVYVGPEVSSLTYFFNQ
jgi:hypothetical protein